MNEIKRKPVTESKWELSSEKGPVWLESGIKQHVVKDEAEEAKKHLAR